MPTYDSYNVPTKAQSIKRNESTALPIPVNEFLIAHFNTDALSAIQREALAELATWEVEAVRVKLRSGRLMVTVRGARWFDPGAHIVLGRRGGIEGQFLGHFGSPDGMFKPRRKGTQRGTVLATLAMVADRCGEGRHRRSRYDNTGTVRLNSY